MKKKYYLLVISFFLISTVLLSIRMYSIYIYNYNVPIVRVSKQRWQKYIFNGNKAHPYFIRKDLRAIDFYKEYSDIFSPSMAGYSDFDLQPFVAEYSITYYTEPSLFSEKVVKIKKGEICYGKGLTQFYGIKSFPSYHKGWRIAVPYSTDRDRIDNMASDIYYVRTKDLMKFSKPYVEQYLWGTYNSNGPGASLDNLIRAYLFDYDYKLYNAGYYISPDLYRSPWDTVNIILLAVSIISFSLIIFYIIKQKEYAGYRNKCGKN